MFKTGDGCSMEYMGRQKRPLPLEPVTVAYRVVSAKKTCEFGVTSPNAKSVHRIF